MLYVIIHHLLSMGIPILAAQSHSVYTRPLPDGAMQLLKVARDRPGAPSSSQPDKKVRFSSVFVDTSPCLLIIPLISFATSSARFRSAAAVPQFAAPCFRTGAASDGSPPAAASSSGRA